MSGVSAITKNRLMKLAGIVKTYFQFASQIKCIKNSITKRAFTHEIANINAFWEPLIELLDHMKRLGFIHSDLAIDYRIVNRVEDIVPTIEAAIARAVAERESVPEAIERM